MATKVEELRERAREVDAKYKEKLKTFNDDNLPSEDDERDLEAMLNARADIADELARTERLHGRQGAAANMGGSVPAVVAEAERVAARADRRSIGEQFVELPAFKDWLAMVAPNGQIPDGTRGSLHSPPLGFKGLRELEMMAALLTGESVTSAGAFVVPDRYPGLTELGRRPLTVRDFVTNLQTGSDSIDFVRITTETNNAAPVAEATNASGSSGVKPESALAFLKVNTPVTTIAHWIPATKRAVMDAPQLRGLIDSFLRYGLEEELEDQIIQGDGVGENFIGILNTSGRQSQAWDTDILTTTRRARRKVRTVGRRVPNAYVMHPEDWEGIDLLQDNEARYYFGGPLVMGTPRLWGLPVIESEGMIVGRGLVGDLKTCILWDREQANISVSDSHADFFIRNLVAILAEMRAAFGVLKPNALVDIDLLA